jgi:hypothetical protein
MAMSEFDFDGFVSVRASVLHDGAERIKELEAELARETELLSHAGNAGSGSSRGGRASMIDRPSLAIFFLHTIKARFLQLVLGSVQEEARWLADVTADYLEAFYEIRARLWSESVEEKTGGEIGNSHSET